MFACRDDCSQSVFDLIHFPKKSWFLDLGSLLHKLHVLFFFITMALHFRALQNFSLYREEAHSFRRRVGDAQCNWFKALENHKCCLLLAAYCLYCWSSCSLVVWTWRIPRHSLWSIHILFYVYLRLNQSCLHVDCVPKAKQAQQDFPLDWDPKRPHCLLHHKLRFCAGDNFSVWSDASFDK